MRNTPLNVKTYNLAVNFGQYAAKQIVLMRGVNSPTVQELLRTGFEQISNHERDCINRFGQTLPALAALRTEEGQQFLENANMPMPNNIYDMPGVITIFHAANGLAKITTATHGLERLRSVVPEPYKGHRVTQSLRRHNAPDLALICARR